MDEPTTPTPKSDDDAYHPMQHYPTPIRAKVQGPIEFCDYMGIEHAKNDIFRCLDVSQRAGHRIASSGQSRLHHNDPTTIEARGHPTVITQEQIREMEQVLETEGLYAWALTWQQLGTEVGIDASWRTIQRAMGSKDYHKCVACRKSWVSEKMAQK